MTTLDIRMEIRQFVADLGPQAIEMENEAELQHELGWFLRHRLPNLRVGVERNIRRFNFEPREFVKKEIDLCLYSSSDQRAAVIELKFPRNGQYPEQMFSFVKDLLFLEQLKKAGFTQAALIVFADERPFYEGTDQGIYGYFRAAAGSTVAHRILRGTISKPTGEKSSELTLSGEYQVEWHLITPKLRYSVIEI